jgi:putative hemolysin
MENLNPREILDARNHKLWSCAPGCVKQMVVHFINWLFRIELYNEFVAHHGHKSGFELIDVIFSHFNVTYRTDEDSKRMIPKSGRLVCVANHPLGGMDGLALLRVIGKIRPDVKIVANELLLYFDGLTDLLLPVDIYSHKPQKGHIKAISEALENDCVVIFFPAAKVARLTIKGIMDKKWNKGAAMFARQHQAPILPIFVGGRNSFLFYFISLLSVPLSMLLLPQELLSRQGKFFEIIIGEIHPADKSDCTNANTSEYISQLRDYVFSLKNQQYPG